MKNKTILIMGGGTAGLISSLFFLNKSKDLDLNLNIKLVSSDKIDPIGVGEGTTPVFANFIENICKIDKKEFLKETKGSFKQGIKFSNWNFDKEYYYHLFSSSSLPHSQLGENLDYDFVQYIINEDLNISQKLLQRKILKSSFDLLEDRKISFNINNGYAYHFSAKLIIHFLKTKCSEFKNFKYIDGTIQNINYNEKGFIQSLDLDNDRKIFGDFFVNCLGFKSENILSKEYFEIKNWDNYILNNSAFAIQVKNSPTEIIDTYTTSTAQEYGWTWKIPQYEKTGYGYVYSDYFINDEEKLYDDLLKTYNIKEKDIFKTRTVKSKPYYNKKQIYNNCLSLGLSSGFVEPLEATSIHMTIVSLTTFFEIIKNELDLNSKYIQVFNDKIEKDWDNVFKFIIYHYFTNNPINDYWKHYKEIEKNKTLDFYIKYQDTGNVIFSKFSYFSVSLGLKIKDFYFSFSKEKYLKENVYDYLRTDHVIDTNQLYSHREILDEINQKNKFEIKYESIKTK